MHGGQSKHASVEMEETDDNYLPPMTPKTPTALKSALKSPGAAPRNFEALLSPTFTLMSPTHMEETNLEAAEKVTTKQQKMDLVSVLASKLF
jgi:hypothetical protein